MGRAWRWLGVWVVGAVCLWGGRGLAQSKTWTWTDGKGYLRSREDLSAILIAHEVWIRTDGKAGERANLTGANLTGAHLTGAHLAKAKLSKAILNQADISGSYLSDADLSGASLLAADLSESSLTSANLSGAECYLANFRHAFLTDANLSKADYVGVNLIEADLTGTDLRGTNFNNANLSFAYFQPKFEPSIEEMSYARGLGWVQFNDTPTPLVDLRKGLLAAGYTSQARQVTAALHRHDANLVPLVIFDWTCAWGADWSHPLVLLGWLCLMCGPVYWVGMHFGRVGGIYQIVLDEVVATKAAKEVVTRVNVGVQWVGRDRLGTRTVGSMTRARRAGLRWRLVGMALRAEWRALRLAFLFSILSALDIGFHEFNVGQWARLLLARDYNLKARGWMRVAGGVQSLVGLGLVALSLLSYFGHPFD